MCVVSWLMDINYINFTHWFDPPLSSFDTVKKTSLWARQSLLNASRPLCRWNMTISFIRILSSVRSHVVDWRLWSWVRVHIHPPSSLHQSCDSIVTHLNSCHTAAAVALLITMPKSDVATQTTLRPCWRTRPGSFSAPAGSPPPVFVPLA